jgi:hypothetical protein
MILTQHSNIYKHIVTYKYTFTYIYIYRYTYIRYTYFNNIHIYIYTRTHTHIYIHVCILIILLLLFLPVHQLTSQVKVQWCSKGSAIVTYSTPAEAQQAINTLNRSTIPGLRFHGEQLGKSPWFPVKIFPEKPIH